MSSIVDTLAALPPPPAEPLRPRIRELIQQSGNKLVVLDDDPTGTQTVYDIPVLTHWDIESLEKEFCNDLACFYLLTNSRSLTSDQTATLHREIAGNLNVAAKKAGKEFTIISRSDSTLRGHFPLEPDILSSESGPYDATFIFPFFEAGGRLTVGDVHYVVEDGIFTPAAETPFARDRVFGYESSNLREWVAEKTHGRVLPEEVEGISIQELRGDGTELTARLQKLPPQSFVIVNALETRDVEAFALATIQAEQNGKRFLYRSAAGLVAARLGLEPRSLWKPESASGHSNGGLIIVGSYVPKTTLQLEHLLQSEETETLQLDVAALLGADRDSVITNCLTQLSDWLSTGNNVTVFTSRELVTGDTPGENLTIGNTISKALVEIVQKLPITPRFLIAKGGITSSDIATDGLGVRRAMVLGQILPGVPTWRLENETRFPGVPYIVFPGNVGGASSLLDAVRIFSPAPRP